MSRLKQIIRKGSVSSIVTLCSVCLLPLHSNVLVGNSNLKQQNNCFASEHWAALNIIKSSKLQKSRCWSKCLHFLLFLKLFWLLWTLPLAQIRWSSQPLFCCTKQDQQLWSYSEITSLKQYFYFTNAVLISHHSAVSFLWMVNVLQYSAVFLHLNSAQSLQQALIHPTIHTPMVQLQPCKALPGLLGAI